MSLHFRPIIVSLEFLKTDRLDLLESLQVFAAVAGLDRILSHDLLFSLLLPFL